MSPRLPNLGSQLLGKIKGGSTAECCQLLALVASNYKVRGWELLMCGLSRSAPSALRVSFASKSKHAVLGLRAYRT